MAVATDINLNSAQCIVTKGHLGYDAITNICTGAERTIQWGAGDWTGAAFIALLLILLLLACVGFGIFIFGAATGRL